MPALSDLSEMLLGSGTDLSVLQMVCRAIVIFIAALVLMRASGRHSLRPCTGTGSPDRRQAGGDRAQRRSR